MRRGGQRGRPRNVSGLAQGRAPPFDTGGGRRDSDASLCSSRPSSAGSRPSALLTDRSSKSAAVDSVDSYLSDHSAAFSLRPPPPLSLPSARNITEAFRLILSHLDWPTTDLDADLPLVLRGLGCPLKLSRSNLKAPATPHAWPSVLSALHWLVQIARYSDHRASSPVPRPPNDLLHYVLETYSLFISGDDDTVAKRDEEYKRRTEQHVFSATTAVDALEKEAADLEGKLRALTSGPSRREALEGERALLVEDVKKFQKVLDAYGGKLAATEARLGEREKDLEAKEREREGLQEENAELKRRVDAQGLNSRDAERMRRELELIEKDIAEAENGRNEAEVKAWELEAAIGRKLKDLMALVAQCNQAIRKLKLGTDFQYVLNLKGSSPAEVMGNYKITLKPALRALAEDTKKSSVSKLEELFTLQQKSQENATLLDDKRKHLTTLQAKIDEVEVRVGLLEKEIEYYSTKCTTEAEKIKDEFKRKENQLVLLEKDAEDFLKVSKQKLQGAVSETEEETQMCARELVAVIDAISEYKEYMESTISGMKKDLSETVRAVGEAHKAYVSAKLVSNSLKRARCPSPS